MDSSVTTNESVEPEFYELPDERVISEADASALKLEVNNIIWMFAPTDMVLAHADALALAIYDMVKGGK